VILLLLALILFSGLVYAGELKVTSEHPFLINGEWVSASDLNIGDKLTLADGRKAVIKNIRKVVPAESFKVYNLETEKYNDFVVGDEGLVVHNSNKVIGDQAWKIFRLTKQKLPEHIPPLPEGIFPQGRHIELTRGNVMGDPKKISLWRGTSENKLTRTGKLTFGGLDSVNPGMIPNSRSAFFSPTPGYSQIYARNWGDKGVILEATLDDLFLAQEKGEIGKIVMTLSNHPLPPSEITVDVVRGKDVGGIFKYYRPNCNTPLRQIQR